MYRVLRMEEAVPEKETTQMPDTTLTNSPIVAAYRERTPGSAALAEEAGGLFPSGLTHDSRRILPYGIYVERAKG